MRLLRSILILIFMFSHVSLADEYREVSWDDLMPEGWEPEPLAIEHDIFGGESFEGQAYDGDLNPISIPESVKEPAPIVKKLDQQKLRIPGYIIPIKFDSNSVTEFLLVPYIGACIHVPPPPENQIIYVSLSKPLMSTEFWEPVWVNGEMRTKMLMTEYATAGYHMISATTDPYEYE